MSTLRVHNQTDRKYVAIVDYGMGNLFSVKQACLKVGLAGEITSSLEKIENADMVILPGVGAFGDAMSHLKERGLVNILKKKAESGTPFIGICLGMQLMMTESEEFGLHKGLDIVPGRVVRFQNLKNKKGVLLKVPQVTWNSIHKNKSSQGIPTEWEETVLQGLPEETYLYFVHSYYVVLSQSDVILAVTRYGDIEFCSAFQQGHIIGFQFHPEKSGPTGLQIYQNLAKL